MNGLQLHTSDKDFYEESSSISNALYVLDAILLYCGDVFAAGRMKSKRPSFKLFWQNQRRQELVICYFGGDLMSDIPHLNEKRFLEYNEVFESVFSQLKSHAAW